MTLRKIDPEVEAVARSLWRSDSGNDSAFPHNYIEMGNGNDVPCWVLYVSEARTLIRKGEALVAWRKLGS